MASWVSAVWGAQPQPPAVAVHLGCHPWLHGQQALTGDHAADVDRRHAGAAGCRLRWLPLLISGTLLGEEPARSAAVREQEATTALSELEMGV